MCQSYHFKYDLAFFYPSLSLNICWSFIFYLLCFFLILFIFAFQNFASYQIYVEAYFIFRFSSFLSYFLFLSQLPSLLYFPFYYSQAEILHCVQIFSSSFIFSMPFVVYISNSITRTLNQFSLLIILFFSQLCLVDHLSVY